jgi:hypothetical protein
MSIDTKSVEELVPSEVNFSASYYTSETHYGALWLPQALSATLYLDTPVLGTVFAEQTLKLVADAALEPMTFSSSVELSPAIHSPGEYP